MGVITRVILLSLVIILCVFKGYSQTPAITIDMKEATLKDIILQIEKSSNYTFAFSENLDMKQRKDISLTNMPITEALMQIFGGTGIGWQILDYHIILNKARKINISGYVTDLKSQETLIGAGIKDESSEAGTFTNSYGYYTIQVVPGFIPIQASYIGYRPVSKRIFVQNDTIINFRLDETNSLLPNVTVYDTKAFSPSGGSIELTGSKINPIPAAFGENDVLKSLQTIPGVKAGVEGTAGMYVRGGNPDQNLILVDGIPVYNTGHVWGLFSVFNGDAVKKVSLHKGSFPARFGGRLSSVVDIRFKDGDMKQFHGDFTIGLLTARLNIEGPIFKEKTSYSLSVRRSYIDGILRIVNEISDNSDVYSIYLYDLNAKLNHKFSDRSRLYLSYYSGRDKSETISKYKYGSLDTNESNNYYKTKYNNNWGNSIVSLRWNYVFNSRLFMNMTAAYNRYRYDSESYGDNRYNEYELNQINFRKSSIRDWQFSTDLEYQPDNGHYIRFGGGMIFHNFSPEMYGYLKKENGDNSQEWKRNYYLHNKIDGREMSLYAEDEFSITQKLKSNLGLHLSLFNVQGKTYTALQPRLSFGYELNAKTGIKISYTKMNQYVNLLSSNIISKPSDLWVPITKNLKPMSSHQFAAGLFFDTKNGYKLSAEGFYKKMNNVLEYKDGIAWKDAFTSWEEHVEAGTGQAYGIELFAAKTSGHFTGWMGYTLSWNNRRFETINRGKRFWGKYDSRHNFNITGTFKCSDKIDLSASWMYATGNRSTLPLETYSGWLDPDWSSRPITYIDGRNNYKMSDNHHLDLEMKYYYSPRKIWTFSIYNVYNRFNPYAVETSYNIYYNKSFVIENSLFGIIPSISFTYKFK